MRLDYPLKENRNETGTGFVRYIITTSPEEEEALEHLAVTCQRSVERIIADILELVRRAYKDAEGEQK